MFEEWSFYAKKRPLLARDMDLDALVKNSESKIIAITGFSRQGNGNVVLASRFLMHSDPNIALCLILA